MPSVRIHSAVPVDRDAVGESARLVDARLEDLVPDECVFVSLLGDDPVIPGPRYEAACHDGLVRGHEGDSFAVGIVDDARLDEAPPVDGTRGTRTDPDAGSLRPDDVEVPDRRVLEHFVGRDSIYEDAGSCRVVSLVSINRQVGNGAAARINREHVRVRTVAEPNRRGIRAGSEDPDVGARDGDRRRDPVGAVRKVHQAARGGDAADRPNQGARVVRRPVSNGPLVADVEHGIQGPRTGNLRHTHPRLARPGRELSCRDSPDRGTESRRGQVLQHAPSRVLPLVVKSHPMHRGAVGGPATKVRLDTFVLRDPIARRNDRVGPKTTVRVGSRSRADSARVRCEPASGRCCLPRPPFWLAERPRTPPRPCFGIDTCRSATATAVNEVGKSFLYSPLQLLSR